MRIPLRQGRVQISLDRLREASNARAPSLLLLHELGGEAADWHDESIEWDGAVYALDFCGHGESEWLRSSVYFPELFLSDADIAHAYIESTGARESCLLGRGMGGYVALQLAGARPDRVRAAAVLPGRGLDGAGNTPGEYGPLSKPAPRGNPQRERVDPRVAFSNEHVRPDEYVASFAARARSLHLSELAGPVPSWWNAAREAGALDCEASVKAATAALAAAPPIPQSALASLGAASDSDGSAIQG